MRAFNFSAGCDDELPTNEQLNVARHDHALDVGAQLVGYRILHLGIEPFRRAFFVDLELVAFDQVRRIHARRRKLNAGESQPPVVAQLVNDNKFAV